MKVERNGDVIHVELTRRNLIALLDKLDDPLSVRTIGKGGDDCCYVWIKAVEDIEHYVDRAPGLIYKPSSREFQ